MTTTRNLAARLVAFASAAVFTALMLVGVDGLAVQQQEDARLAVAAQPSKG